MSKLLISKVYHFSVELFSFKIEYIGYTVEYVALALKCIMFAQEFITVTPTAATHHKVTTWDTRKYMHIHETIQLISLFMSEHTHHQWQSTANVAEEAVMKL